MKVNTTGITNRLNKVEVMRPPITAAAIGLRNEGSATPLPKAIGSMPAPTARDRQLTQATRVENPPESRVGFPILLEVG